MNSEATRHAPVLVELLALEGRQDAVRHRRALWYGVIAGILDLFLCGFLTGDVSSRPTEQNLIPLLFSQAIFYMLFVVAHFISVTRPILTKSTVFPLSSMQRYLFALANDLRHPVAIAIWCVTVLALVAVFPTSIIIVFVGIGVLILFLASVQIVTSATLVLLTRNDRPAQLAALFFGVLLVVLLNAGVLMGSQRLLADVPIVSWASAAIQAAWQGGWNTVLLYCGFLSVVIVLFFWGGKKLS